MSLSCRRKFELLSKKIKTKTKTINLELLSNEESNDFLQAIVCRSIVLSIFETLISEMVALEHIYGDDFLSGVLDDMKGVTTIEDLWFKLSMNYNQRRKDYHIKENGKGDIHEIQQQFLPIISNHYEKNGFDKPKLKIEEENKNIINNNFEKKFKLKEKAEEHKDEDMSLLVHLVSSLGDEDRGDFTENNLSELSLNVHCSKVKNREDIKESNIIKDEVKEEEVEAIHEVLEVMLKKNEVVAQKIMLTYVHVETKMILKASFFRTKVVQRHVMNIEEESRGMSMKEEITEERSSLSSATRENFIEAKNIDDHHNVDNSNNFEGEDNFNNKKENKFFKYDNIFMNEKRNESEENFNKNKNPYDNNGDRRVNLVIKDIIQSNKSDKSVTIFDNHNNVTALEKNEKSKKSEKFKETFKENQFSHEISAKSYGSHNVIDPCTFNVTYGIKKLFSEVFEENIIKYKINQSPELVISGDLSCQEIVLNETVIAELSCEDINLKNVKVNEGERRVNCYVKLEELVNKTTESTLELDTVGVFQFRMLRGGVLLSQVHHLSSMDMVFSKKKINSLATVLLFQNIPSMKLFSKIYDMDENTENFAAQDSFELEKDYDSKNIGEYRNMIMTNKRPPSLDSNRIRVIQGILILSFLCVVIYFFTLLFKSRSSVSTILI